MSEYQKITGCILDFHLFLWPAIAKCATETNHQINFKATWTYFPKLCREAIEIFDHLQNINRKDEALHISNTWLSVLTRTNIKESWASTLQIVLWSFSSCYRSCGTASSCGVLLHGSYNYQDSWKRRCLLQELWRSAPYGEATLRILWQVGNWRRRCVPSTMATPLHSGPIQECCTQGGYLNRSCSKHPGTSCDSSSSSFAGFWPSMPGPDAIWLPAAP